MEINFNTKDYKFIAECIANNFTSSYIEIDLNGLLLSLSYKLNKIGYEEIGYDNGTGAFVCTDFEFELIDISTVNIDATLDFYDRLIEDELSKILIDK